MNFSRKLDPVKGMAAITECAAMFLETHMPSLATVAAMPADSSAAVKASPNVRQSVVLDFFKCGSVMTYPPHRPCANGDCCYTHAFMPVLVVHVL